MSNRRVTSHFSFDEAADLVRAAIQFPKKEAFLVVATPVPEGDNHWPVLANSLREVGQRLFSIADTIEGKPRGRITFAR